MSERTVLGTMDRQRYRLIEHVRDDLRAEAVEISLGTLEQILDIYDRRRVRVVHPPVAPGDLIPRDKGIRVARIGW